MNNIIILWATAHIIFIVVRTMLRPYNPTGKWLEVRIRDPTKELHGG